MPFSNDAPAEIGWFRACCADDFQFRGVPDPALASTRRHVRDIAPEADRVGFANVLLPSGCVPGVDPWTTASALFCPAQGEQQ